jgi:hypothetical protein
MRALALFPLLLLAVPALADSKSPDDNHLIDNDRVGPFHTGMAEKDVLDAALKMFGKADVKLGEDTVTLPHLVLHFSKHTSTKTLLSIDVLPPTIGASDYRTAEGVGPGASEKDVRLAYRDEVKHRKVGGADGIVPNALPGVHFVCPAGGMFNVGKCTMVTVTKKGK